MFKIPREEEGGREDPLSKKNNENNNKKTGKYRKYLRVTDIIEISDEAGIIPSSLQRKSETSNLVISTRKYTLFQTAHRSYRFFLIRFIRIRKKERIYILFETCTINEIKRFRFGLLSKRRRRSGGGGF